MVAFVGQTVPVNPVSGTMSVRKRQGCQQAFLLGFIWYIHLLIFFKGSRTGHVVLHLLPDSASDSCKQYAHMHKQEAFCYHSASAGTVSLGFRVLGGCHFGFRLRGRPCPPVNCAISYVRVPQSKMLQQPRRFQASLPQPLLL